MYEAVPLPVALAGDTVIQSAPDRAVQSQPDAVVTAIVPDAPVAGALMGAVELNDATHWALPVELNASSAHEVYRPLLGPCESVINSRSIGLPAHGDRSSAPYCQEAGRPTSRCQSTVPLTRTDMRKSCTGNRPSENPA